MTSVLREQSIAGLPGWFTIPFIAIAWTGLAIRVMLIHPKVPSDRAANWYMFFTLSYTTLRESWFQRSVLASLNQVDIRTFTYMCAPAGGAALLLLALRWFRKSGSTPRWATWFLILLTVVIWATMWWSVWPTRGAGIAVEEIVGSWRSGAYLASFCMIYPFAEMVILFGLIKVWKSSNSSQSAALRKFFVLAGIFAILVSCLDCISRALGGVLLSMGVVGELTNPRTAIMNDSVFFPSVILCAAVGFPSCMRAVRSAVGLDKSSLAVRKLDPMWLDLTTAMPTYLLNEVGEQLKESAEVEHRMRIEIEDTICALTEYLPGTAETWPTTPESRAATLRAALDRYAAGCLPVQRSSAPNWLSDDENVDAIARVWTDVQHDPAKRTDQLSAANSEISNSITSSS